MKKIDLIGRIRRTIACQKRRWYHKHWLKIQPQDFYDNPERVTAIWYASREGRMPNFNNPSEFNERLMAINLAAFKDEKQHQLRIIGADKYSVRDYVKSRGFADILVECYGVYDSFDDIDFDKLPNQFVMKTTNASGQNYICLDKSKMNISAVKKQFVEWMNGTQDFGLTTGEWHYSQIKPRIIIEKYMTMLGENMSLVDYKFHCIHGHVYGEYVCYDRIVNTHIVNYDHYDAEWNLTDGVFPQFHPTQRLLPKPLDFEKMKEIAKALSEGIDYVRVDLYDIDGKIYFGELTFTPMGNYLPYRKWLLEDMEQFYRKTKTFDK